MVTSNQQPVTSLVLRAPAKINLVLRVLGKREDGYHELLMLNEKLGLADEIAIEYRGQSTENRRTRDESSIVVTCDDPSVPCDERNLCWKAVSVMLSPSTSLRVNSAKNLHRGDPSSRCSPPAKSELRMTTPIHIHIKKRIPVAAGLGGGSSDAAAVLIGLNKLFGLNLSNEKLAEIGVEIGADVPFFFCDGAAICEGIGERVTPVIGDQSPANSNQLPVTSLPNLWILLVNPRFPVSTKWAYEEFDRTIAQNGGLELTGRGLNARLRPDLNDLIKIIHNDLEEVVSRRHPEINEIETRLIEAGAKKAWMSGSGPTVVGLFESERARDRAGERLENPRWRVISTTNGFVCMRWGVDKW